VMPGIVRGGYESEPVRVATARGAYRGEAALGEGFGTNPADPFPQLSPMDVGEVSALYLTALTDGPPDQRARPALRDLTTAGRPRDEVLRGLVGAVTIDSRARVRIEGRLPAYCYGPGVVLGGLPDLEPGRVVRVPLTPIGQLF
jgi:hypothetical protein